MAGTIKLSVKMSGGVANVKSLVLHPMETGSRTDPDSGNIVPAQHITQMIFTHNGRQVMVANFSTAVSRDPFFGFSFEGASPGDTLKVSWVDNTGATDEFETQLT